MDILADHTLHLLLLSFWFDGSSGPHDNYGSALSAQPGGSQGRPATNTSSRLNVRIGLPTYVLPVPLVPDGHTIRQDQAIQAGRAGTVILIPVTNPIESTFATVRHRTIRSRGCLSNKTALAMIFKLAQAAEKSWYRLRGYNQLPKVILGVKFNNGIEVVRTQAQAAAA